MMKPMTHKLKTIQDVVNVATRDNMDLLIADIAGIIRTLVGLKDTGITMHEDGVDWTDDGKVGISFLRMHNTDTGEVTKIDNPQFGKTPLLLNYEWMNLFGFENYGYDLLFWKIGDFELAGLDLEEGRGSYAYNWYLSVGDNYVHKQIEVTTVLQLCRLYRAITGKELTIKE